MRLGQSGLQRQSALDETAPAVETELSFEIKAKGVAPPRPRMVTVWPLMVAVTAPESVMLLVAGSMWYVPAEVGTVNV
jgi:hypothetical protein